MTYDPTIPILSHNITVDASQIQTNFSQLNTLYGQDHFSFNNATVGSRGLHKQITFPSAPTEPVPTGTITNVYPKVDALDTGGKIQLYFRNASTTTQLTNAFSSAVTNGYYMLPGGFIIMWGFVASPSLTAAIDFNAISNYAYSGGQTKGFPNNCFNIVTTISTDDSTTKTCSVNSGYTKTGFTYRVSSVLVNGFFWQAIGN